MINMTLSQAAKIANVSLLGNDLSFTGISIDSRADCTGTLFVAIKGKNFNAEDFCQQALDNGANAVLVSQDIGLSAPQLISKDVISSLTSMGQYWAKHCPAKIIAITGSNGKTTVKNMLKSIFTIAHKCCATVGNFNNELGVPLTLCNIGIDDDYAVIEMGAAKLGDISHLIALVEATTTILTNASPAHIGRFGSFENIVKEKGQICAQLNENQHSILPIDDDNYDYWFKHTNASVSSFGYNENADVRAIIKEKSFDIISNTSTIKDIHLPVAGTHNKINAACACAAALTFGIAPSQIKQGLEQFTPEKGRLQNMGIVNGNELIDDSYNANSASVKAAIDVLAQYKSTTTLVFGDMAELGEESDTLHQMVGKYCKDKNISHLLTIGKKSLQASLTFSNEVKNFNDIESLKTHLLHNWEQYGTILVKGSRSMHLEDLITALINVEKTA